MTTETHVRELATQGFTLLREAVPSTLLARWQELATALESRALEAHSSDQPLPPGAAVVDDPVGPRLMRHDDILEHSGDHVLDLLACPAMLAVARDLTGTALVPLQLDILYKHPHPHPVIKWHQGAPHPRGYPYLNVGIYLDDADPGDGCLRFVPGTQHELQDICRLTRDHGWDIPGTVEQPARAGDIVVQEMMILHGSPPKRSPGPRRTVYVELRAPEGISESGAQSDGWREARERWMALVLRRAHGRADRWSWPAPLPTDLRPDRDEIELITTVREPPIPSVYCSETIETDDYPVPFDLRVASPA